MCTSNSSSVGGGIGPGTDRTPAHRRAGVVLSGRLGGWNLSTPRMASSLRTSMSATSRQALGIAWPTRWRCTDMLSSAVMGAHVLRGAVNA